MISFIVPVKNGLALTRGLVETTRAGNPSAEIEWIIVDSGSTDGTPEYCREIGARLVPFRSEPFNYCAAINVGVEHACGDVWIVANNDVELRSYGDLARLEAAFRGWPLLSVVSPGRPSGEASLEFLDGGINGACWAVRPEAFRSWGGMPERMSGYGYDEAFTAFQCWRRGYGIAWLTGWDVFHHGSETFGPLGGNVAPALRRNLSRLLEEMNASDLDTHDSPARIMNRLILREKQKAPARLQLMWSPDARWLQRQGYVNAAPLGTATAPTVTEGAGGERFQWLPWLANELLLQPEVQVVGKAGWYASRSGDVNAGPLTAKAIGPEPSPLMAPVRHKTPTLRQRLSAVLHAWRNRRASLPGEW
jgi:GT2 family glycosyltransferase